MVVKKYKNTFTCQGFYEIKSKIVRKSLLDTSASDLNMVASITPENICYGYKARSHGREKKIQLLLCGTRLLCCKTTRAIRDPLNLFIFPDFYAAFSLESYKSCTFFTIFRQPQGNPGLLGALFSPSIVSPHIFPFGQTFDARMEIIKMITNEFNRPFSIFKHTTKQTGKPVCNHMYPFKSIITNGNFFLLEKRCDSCFNCFKLNWSKEGLNSSSQTVSDPSQRKQQGLKLIHCSI